MGIINCEECGKVCLENASLRCPDCQQELQRSEERVVLFLEDYPGSSLDEVHKATRVSRHIIMQMIRNNRVLTGLMNYPCESCGKPVTQGRICPACADDAIRYLKPRETTASEPERRPGAMHIRHQADRRR
ncbi:MAG: hypothetical protein P4N41_15485 [Negativicutes bacterium]|nr:hypothetical protein [Negativicutes bacterium]